MKMKISKNILYMYVWVCVWEWRFGAYEAYGIHHDARNQKGAQQI